MPGRQQTCGFAQIRAAQEAPAGRQAARALHRYRAGSACRLVSPSPGQDRFGPAHHLRPGGPPRGRQPRPAHRVVRRGRSSQSRGADGSRGAAELKRRAIDAVNERLRPVRDRRSELMRDRGYPRTVLRDGSAAARGIAQSTSRGSPPPCTRTTDPAPRTVDASSPLSQAATRPGLPLPAGDGQGDRPGAMPPVVGRASEGIHPRTPRGSACSAVLGVRARRSCPPRDLAQ